MRVTGQPCHRRCGEEQGMFCPGQNPSPPSLRSAWSDLAEVAALDPDAGDRRPAGVDQEARRGMEEDTVTTTQRRPDRRAGRPPKEPKERRVHMLSVYVNADELAALERRTAA